MEGVIMRNKQTKPYHDKVALVFIYVFSFLFIFNLVHNEPVHTYIKTIKSNSIHVNLPEDKLAHQIKTLAEKVDQPAVDAKIDSIWKAIQGYDGIKVNQEKTYQLSKVLGQVSMETLIIEKVSPSITLEDLPAHPIYRGNPQKPMISFMVNVAWGTEYVTQMLDLFDDYQIKVTFFLDGMWLKDHEDIAREMIKRGHEIGNHAYSHPDLSKKSNQAIHSEIVKTEKLINKLGVHSQLFAPPSGSYDQRVVEIADKLNMKVVLWTLDTVDWKKPSAEQIVGRIVPNLTNGALILMHPTSSTVKALPSIIESALQKEFHFGTASELLSTDRVLSVVGVD